MGGGGWGDGWGGGEKSRGGGETLRMGMEGGRPRVLCFSVVRMGVRGAPRSGGVGGEHKEVGDSLVCGCLHGPECGGFIHLWGALGHMDPKFGVTPRLWVPWARMDPNLG